MKFFMQGRSNLFLLIQKTKNKYMKFFSKERFKKFVDVIYKEEYENLLQQDRFWFKSVTWGIIGTALFGCLLYTSPSPRDGSISRMPSSA